MRSWTALGRFGARKMTATALLLAALEAPAALADARTEAKRHFRDGMSLIAAGQVERGIAELKQAYAIKPHPVVLYDIARAYLDVGNIHEALSYFRQYAATDPVDKEQVQTMIRRLEAAIGSAAPPTAAAQPASTPTSPAELEKLMAQLKELIQKAQQQQQQQAAPEAKTAVAKTQESPPGDDDMFEEQTISPRTPAPAAGR